MRFGMTMVLLAGLCCGGASAQIDSGTMAPSKALDQMLNSIEGQVISAAKAMPADKYGFAPSKAIFAEGQNPEFATVRTFAQQVQHLTQANYFFYGTVGGMKPDVNVKAIGSMTNKDDLVKALEASFAFAHKANATLTAANAFAIIKGVDGMETRATVSAFGVAHGFDHYGQLVEYLRMNGIVPPASAK